MPTRNKRVNLTVRVDLYEKIQKYMKENGINADAAACLQLITQALNNFNF